jgi:hypothetical protein
MTSPDGEERAERIQQRERLRQMREHLREMDSHLRQMSERLCELDEHLRLEEEENQRWHERWDDRSGMASPFGYSPTF